MRLSKARVRSAVHAIPDVRFESDQLTCFGGAVLIQALFRRLDMRLRLVAALREARSRVYGLEVVFLQLVMQLMLGLRSLRDRDACQGDPLPLAHNEPVARPTSSGCIGRFPGRLCNVKVYAYAVVGVTGDNKLVAVYFGAVET